METDFDTLKGTTLYDELLEGWHQGFKIFRQVVQTNDHHTALNVADAFYYAKKRKYLTKNDETNYNNRWLQFTGDFHPDTQKIADYFKKRYKFSQQHIYANWKENGFNFGRHNDSMDVLIYQLWGKVGYCVESPYGDEAHISYVLAPGDAIYIRAGTYHTPIIHEQRMSLSFSWK